MRLLYLTQKRGGTELINKLNIIRLEIRNLEGKVLLTTQSFEFAKDFFAIKSNEFVIIKGNDLPEIPKGEPVDVYFYYRNGTRIKVRTGIDIASGQQINFHVGNDYIVMEEHRSSYKTNVDINGTVFTFKRGEDIFDFEKPYLTVHIHNINLGGVFISSAYEFTPDDLLSLQLIRDDLVLDTRILRRQLDEDGHIVGYGCCFEQVRSAQEAIISRFIFDCQLAEREKGLV